MQLLSISNRHLTNIWIYTFELFKKKVKNKDRKKNSLLPSSLTRLHDSCTWWNMNKHGPLSPYSTDWLLHPPLTSSTEDWVLWVSWLLYLQIQWGAGQMIQEPAVWHKDSDQVQSHILILLKIYKICFRLTFL